MGACVVCPLCNTPGTLRDAPEVVRVPCNVRRLRNHLFTLWRCRSCHSLHSAESADLDFYYAHFPFQQHKLDFHARIGYRNRLRLLRRRALRRSDRILDYGCGTGLFVQFLKDCGYPNSFGYDRFIRTWSDPAVLEDEYDAVVSYDVIEHVEDPRDFMRSVAGQVKTGGLLVIGTPNARNLTLEPGNLLTPELSQPYHRHILSEEALLDLGAELGLTPEHVYRRFYFDSLFPGVNTRFMWSYIAARGGMIDAAVEPPSVGTVLRSPRLMLQSVLGYFTPPRGNILVSFRKPS